jgi:hypothetical protein
MKKTLPPLTLIGLPFCLFACGDGEVALRFDGQLGKRPPAIVPR